MSNAVQTSFGATSDSMPISAIGIFLQTNTMQYYNQRP